MSLCLSFPKTTALCVHVGWLGTLPSWPTGSIFPPQCLSGLLWAKLGYSSRPFLVLTNIQAGPPVNQPFPPPWAGCKWSPCHAAMCWEWQECTSGRRHSHLGPLLQLPLCALTLSCSIPDVPLHPTEGCPLSYPILWTALPYGKLVTMIPVIEGQMPFLCQEPVVSPKLCVIHIFSFVKDGKALLQGFRVYCVILQLGLSTNSTWPLFPMNILPVP